jgi:response regulator NasT
VTTVVIAEDEAIVRLDLRELLADEGYEVVGETGRGDEAVDLVRQHRPDLVILDIKMPGMDGLTAAHAINAERKTAVLILTAFSQRDLIEQARDAGALAYLVKPFQKEELLPAIEVALARFNEMVALEAENASLSDDKRGLEEQLETRRWIDRAKGKLMDDHGMREGEAFSFIQQTAMNTRTTMRDVAKGVVEGTVQPPAAEATS